MTVERSDLRCTLTALLAAWVTMVFGASLLIAAFGPGPGPSTLQELGRAVWKGADDMGPAVKLLLIVLFALQLLGGRRRRDPERTEKSLVAGGILGAFAMLYTVALIPRSYSRGFAVGLTGTRFDLAILPLYLCAGAVGGIVFTLSRAKCRAARS
jgi:hypothetical protein